MKLINITVEADDRKAGMSIGDLEGFVREAMAAGVYMNSRVEATVGFRGQLQKISIAGSIKEQVRTVDLDGPGDRL